MTDYLVDLKLKNMSIDSPYRRRLEIKAGALKIICYLSDANLLDLLGIGQTTGRSVSIEPLSFRADDNGWVDVGEKRLNLREAFGSDG